MNNFMESLKNFLTYMTVDDGHHGLTDRHRGASARAQKQIYDLDFFLSQDGLLSQGNHDLIMRIYNKIPKLSSDGKRLLQVMYTESSGLHVCNGGDNYIYRVSQKT